MKYSNCYFVKYRLYILILLIIALTSIHNIGYSQLFDDDEDEVELCGLPSNGWNFENIIGSSCTDIGCNSYGNNPEFQNCLCGNAPGIACNYRLSHGTPHLHPITVGTMQEHFGAMVGGVRAGISRGEGIYFCATTYRDNTCVNLDFDLILRRDFNYTDGYLYIKLVRPDEMITQAGVPPSSCALTPPNINSIYLQDLAIINVQDYQQYNGTTNFIAQPISFSFFPANNVVLTDPTHNIKYYYLWFYYQGGPNGNDQLMGIDNIELSLAYSDPPVCEQYIPLYDYDAPIEGDYLAENVINIYSLNNLFIQTTATFTAGQQIQIDPNSVSTNLMSDDDFVLFCVKPVDCSPCSGYVPPIPPPPPYRSSETNFRSDDDNFHQELKYSSIDKYQEGPMNESGFRNNGLKKSSYEVVFFNILGQIVYTTDEEYPNVDVLYSKLIPYCIYFKVVRINGVNISSETFTWVIN